MYSNILIAIDLDEPSSWEKPLATGLAMADCFGAQVALAYVVPETGLMLQAQWSVSSVRAVMDEAKIRLMQVASEHASGWDTKKIVRSGSVYAGLIGAAEEFNADLIALGSHRPEMKDYLLGANASRVVRHANCSVMVVRK